VVRALGLAACLAAAVGCHGLTTGEQLGGAGPRDAGVRRPDGGADAIAVRPTTDAAADRLAPPAVSTVPSGDPPGDGGAVACAASAWPAQDGGVAPPAPAWGPATTAPFSCDPLPGAYFFARPGADTPGVYARCASFGEARATALAVSSDGARVALIGSDGVARIVDVASHTVVGVLAPSRASVGLAAFSPAGDTILTVAKGERVATLWRADTFAPVWSTNLPGHTYFNTWQGTAAFSPDGAHALVSPGGDLFLLDAATGNIVAARQAEAVTGAGYGWNGRRVVVEEAGVGGMCAAGPLGATVTILDPSNLAPLATPMSWPAMSDEGPPPGQMLVAADADVLVMTGPWDHPSPEAFRVSDGSPLPPPGIATVPLALTPDGTAGVFAAAGVLELERISDGAVLASVPIAAPSALAVSADGASIAVGSKGASLLGIWRPTTDGTLRPTCSAEQRPDGRTDPGAQLSADGQLVGQNWGTQVRFLRRTEGTPISTIDLGNADVWNLSLSADGAYAIVESLSTSALFRTTDGGQVTDLGNLPCTSTPFFGLKADNTIDALCDSNDGSSTLVTRQSDGHWVPQSRFAQWTEAAGSSGECLVLVAFHRNVAWRSCGTCSEPPFATNTGFGVVSQDGTMFLGQDTVGQAVDVTPVDGVTLWNVLASGDAVRKYPPRPEEATWDASEVPIAVSAHGDRVITGAQKFADCGNWPAFTSRIHDVAADTVVDELPPGVTSTSADLTVVAIGEVLWCAR
jgi:WD40 repeat protein